MRILMVSAEVAPFATVGGLSQVLYFLSKSLLKTGNDVRIFTPLHGKIKQRIYKSKPIIQNLKVPTDSPRKYWPSSVECTVRLYKKTKPITYFLENREYYTLRENVFGYKDDHQRFYLLSRACLEWLLLQKKNKDWMPDVIHVHDWHAGYLIELARTQKRYQKALKNIPILYTIHNFRYQGNMDFAFLPPQERDSGKLRLKSMMDPKLQMQNALLRGILYADWINTVSPTHSLEVLTKEYGEGLDKFLLKRRATLSGIINGLDTNMFDPGSDPLIEQPYTVNSIDKRSLNKEALQKEFGLDIDPKAPLIAFSGRLDKQKGLHLILEVLEHLIKELGIQFVILGGGDQQLASEFNALKDVYPGKIGAHLYPNFKLPRKIFAGADMLLIPSMFEPGGIVALEALRYGCIPIVRRTGGLADIVKDFDPQSRKGNGFSFETAQGLYLLIACVRAIETFR
ncbi:MAG TPA: glycogen/starch synthase, partial [Patescibacteria group bacterium]|nr:glycogen/starch synthase [Patescibacteria group bacterium]